jgi:hypothetical protein
MSRPAGVNRPIMAAARRVFLPPLTHRASGHLSGAAAQLAPSDNNIVAGVALCCRDEVDESVAHRVAFKRVAVKVRVFRVATA